MVLAQGVLRILKKEQYSTQLLCASDWNIPNCGSCGQFKNKKKLFVKPPSPLAHRHRPYPLPLKFLTQSLQFMLVSTYLHLQVSGY